MKYYLPLLLTGLLLSMFMLTSKEIPKEKQPPIPRQQQLSEFQGAIKLLAGGRKIEAEKAFHELRNKNIALNIWGMSSFNLALSLRMQKKFTQAIDVLKEVLESKLNDKDPAPGIMEHYMNYRNKACIEISFNYQLLNDYSKSLEYMELAKTKYQFIDSCGSCLKQISSDWNKRFKYLQKKQQAQDKGQQ